MDTVPVGVSLLAGGIAGTAVDVALYPLDTIKTRLQSSGGLWRSGGFRRIYSGLASAVAGSAPGAALFFCAYELLKNLSAPYFASQQAPLVHMVAACLGEIAACSIRVPVEVVKQRTQANLYSNSLQSLVQTMRAEGIQGLYRGYRNTVAREIPFALIEYPLWEFFKQWWSHSQGSNLTPIQGALCGALAGGFAAAATTPLDVAKTRVILAEKASVDAKARLLPMIMKIGQREGLSGVFAGIVPRVFGISLGGFIFFGAYESTKSLAMR